MIINLNDNFDNNIVLNTTDNQKVIVRPDKIMYEPATGGTAAIWGNLTGNIYNQTDLINVINLKTNLTLFNSYTGTTAPLTYEAIGTAATIMSSHNSTYDHTLIATALQSETDPVFLASQAANITATDITNLGNLSGVNTGDQELSGYTTNAVFENYVDSIAPTTYEYVGVADSIMTTHINTYDHSLIATALQSETDPVFTSSQAANITATDITNLGNLSGTNSGDQDLSPYLTSLDASTTYELIGTAVGLMSTHNSTYNHSLIATALQSETDPVYSASQAANITATDITNLGNLSGVNSGDQDLSGLLPKTSFATYTGTTETRLIGIENDITGNTASITGNTTKINDIYIQGSIVPLTDTSNVITIDFDEPKIMSYTMTGNTSIEFTSTGTTKTGAIVELIIDGFDTYTLTIPTVVSELSGYPVADRAKMVFELISDTEIHSTVYNL